MNASFRAKAEAELEKRKVRGNYRSLSVFPHLIDFYSNDYLGLARSKALQKAIAGCTRFDQHEFLNGSGGSRLLAGNSDAAMQLESDLAEFYHSPESIIFNSGYDANLAFFSSLPGRGDTVIHDELIHASIIDGIRLSFARRLSFRHNDCQDLISKLAQASGSVFIAIESLYSMDGDFSPLESISEIAIQHAAMLIIDEAHSTGILGIGGRGLSFNLDPSCNHIIRLHTFGKAAGTHGAVWCLPGWLKEYLVNFARPFVFSTSLPPKDLAAIAESHVFMEKADLERDKLMNNISFYIESMESIILESSNKRSPIQAVAIPGNERCKNAAELLREKGFHARSILSPTVKEGDEKLRVCIHSFNTFEEIKGISQALVHILEQD